VSKAGWIIVIGIALFVIGTMMRALAS